MAETSVGDYALLSDCHSAAIVGRSGSIDWYCPQRFDAPAIFARLLDPAGGAWSISPSEPTRIERAYLHDTLVLRTVFHTAQGSVALTDALALAPGVREHQLGAGSPHMLVRRIEGLSGQVALRMECAPRPEYGRVQPEVTLSEHGARFSAGALRLELQAPFPLQLADGAATAQLTVRAGDVFDLALACLPAAGPAPAIDVGAELENASAAWRSWAEAHQGYKGPYPDLVRHSALILQGLTYQPTGAIVAAATTSLPEQQGGSANWDYRYAWLRDFSLTMRALYVAACPTQAARYFQWVVQSLGDAPAAGQNVQIMFGVAGERELTETTLPHLRGFQDSRPVRIGNAAWQQQQHDVLGEVIDAVYLFRDNLGELDGSLTALIVALADQAAARWHTPDAGMWEARDQERHYLSSKVMCWVALDRALKLAPQLSVPEPTIAHWQQERTALKAAILTQGWSEAAGAYSGAFGSDNLDASVLLMPLVDLLPASEPRMRATIEAIASRLCVDGLVYRWDGDVNGFLLCSFWLVECLARLGERKRATELFERVCAYANDLGLMAEMADPADGALWGNFPQAFSHVGLINAAWSLADPALA